VARETLQKKAFTQHRKKKNRLPKRAHVLFSAPILITRLQKGRVSAN